MRRWGGVCLAHPPPWAHERLPVPVHWRHSPGGAPYSFHAPLPPPDAGSEPAQPGPAVPAMVELGPRAYDLEQHSFPDCVLDVALPESAYQRMD